MLLGGYQAFKEGCLLWALVLSQLLPGASLTAKGRGERLKPRVSGKWMEVGHVHKEASVGFLARAPVSFPETKLTALDHGIQLA